MLIVLAIFKGLEYSNSENKNRNQTRIEANAGDGRGGGGRAAAAAAAAASAAAPQDERTRKRPTDEGPPSQEEADLLALESSRPFIQRVSVASSAEQRPESSQFNSSKQQVFSTTIDTSAGSPRAEQARETRRRTRLRPRDQQRLAAAAEAAENVRRATNQQQQHEQIDILLERDSFILHNRCSMNRLYVQMNKRTKRAQIGSKQQKTAAASRASGRSTGPSDSARIKLLSMIITVESVSPPTQQFASTTAASAALAPEQQRRHAAGSEAAPAPPMAPISKRAAQVNEVKLRANLTELYICFDPSGNLEAKVSSL